MIMYKLTKIFWNNSWVVSQHVLNTADNLNIPFDPANTDYQTFKAQISADEAQLEDADGNLMTSTESKAFVATLP